MAFIGNTPTTQAFTPAVDYFSGNGSTTAFTLSRPVASVAQVQVTIDNVAQNPSSAYTVSSNTITFTSAPLSGTNNIYVYYTSPITQVIAPGQGTVGLTALSATGTASASTYLRGDNSWAAIASSQWTTTGSDIYYNTGNVGIGTASPAANPKVNIKQANNTTDGGLLITSADGSGSAGLARLNDGGMTFRNAGAEQMRIDSSGNVVIGTTGSNSKLLVADTNNRTQATAQFSITGNGYSAYHFLDSVAYSIGQNSDARNLKMYSGSNSGTGVQLAAGGTSWGTYSDERIKTGLAPIENALTKVSTLRAVTGRYNTDADTVSRAFLIAQDVQAVLPEAVDEEKDELKTLTLKYTEVIPLLVASIKELKQINDTQAATINALTARIEALEGK